jgi:hypothetical protein
MITDMRQIIITQKNILDDNGIEAVQGEEELFGPEDLEIELEEEDGQDDDRSDDDENFDNFDDGEVESYKNF